MDDQRFRERLDTWLAAWGKLSRAEQSGLSLSDDLGYPRPLDAALDALCALYREADPAQHERLAAVALAAEGHPDCSSPVATSLLTYIRRCGRRMRDPRDIEMLRLGMTAAMLAGERVDARDLAVALVFLRAGAARAGIAPAQAIEVLEETIPESVTLASGQASADAIWPSARQVIGGVFRSDEATIARILAYHMGTG